MDDFEEVFETFNSVVEDLWSSPLMKHKSPFDDYTDLYKDIDFKKNTIPVLKNPISTPSRSSSSSMNDDTDFDFIKPTSVKPAQKKPSSLSGRGHQRIPSSPGHSASAVAASGAVDEELFIKSFEDVPNVKIFSNRDVQEQMQKIKDVLSDSNVTWEKRIDYLKLLRSLIISGAAVYDDFFQSLRTLESAFMLSVKDLRSQVVREGCVTIAYLSQQLGTKCDHFAESVLPSLINLIPNGAKVMSTSGIVCIRFIMQFVHSSRLIPIITSNLTSKSSIIRRYCLEFVNQILHSWPTHCLEKHIAILQDAIKRGISDADSEARAHSRKAFWGFADHFKSQADSLLSSLDPSKQKMLQGEVSNSSSSSSLNGGDHLRPPKSRSRAASEERSGYGGSLTPSLRKPATKISSSKSDAGDVCSNISRCRTTSTTSNDSNNDSAFEFYSQPHSTRVSKRHTSASDADGSPGLSKAYAADLGLLQPSSVYYNFRTPQPRATLLSAARMAKTAATSLRKEELQEVYRFLISNCFWLLENNNLAYSEQAFTLF